MFAENEYLIGKIIVSSHIFFKGDRKKEWVIDINVIVLNMKLKERIVVGKATLRSFAVNIIVEMARYVFIDGKILEYYQAIRILT